MAETTTKEGATTPPRHHARLMRLEVRNFLKIRAGVWDLKPGLNRLTSDGRNRQGKTALLRAIRTLFEGAGAVPPEPRNSEAEPDDEALVRTWLDDGWTIRRTFTEKDTYLHVTSPDGAKGRQGTLNDWVGDGHFNPLSFFRKSEEEQARALISLAKDPGFEERLAELNAEEEKVRQERTPWISEQQVLQRRKEPEGERPQAVDTTASLNRLEDLQEARRKRERTADALKAKVRQGQELANEMERVRQKIASLTEELSALGEAQQELQEQYVAQKSAYDAMEDPTPEITDLTARVREATATDSVASQWAEWDRAQERLHEVNREVGKLNGYIRQTQEARRRLIAEAEFPIPGLSFTEEGRVLLNGHPLTEASGRERIEVAVLAAKAKDPRLRLVLVDEGNDVDQEGLDNLARLAEEHDLQIIVARLGLEGPGELEVVDGWGPGAGEDDEEPNEEG